MGVTRFENKTKVADITPNTDEILNKVADITPNIDEILNAIYPIGVIVCGAKPSIGTWERIQGRFLWASNTAHPAGSTGGEETHKLTVNEMPSHSHGLKSNSTDGNKDWVLKDHRAEINISNMNFQWEGKAVSNTGGGQPHNNMPPYLSVDMWRRTA